jgi:hypothetical protein
MGPKMKPSQAATEHPRILRYCRGCERETPHEIHTADGMSIKVCACCVERALMYELDRD